MWFYDFQIDCNLQQVCPILPAFHFFVFKRFINAVINDGQSEVASAVFKSQAPIEAD